MLKKNALTLKDIEDVFGPLDDFKCDSRMAKKLFFI